MKGKETNSKLKQPITRGPKPQVLKIDGNWRDAVKRSLAKKKRRRVGRSKGKSSVNR
jgi:hypothetical protein